MGRYAIVDESGNVVNVVEWDGEADWEPPEGTEAVEHELAGPGGTLIDGVWTPPEPQE